MSGWWSAGDVVLIAVEMNIRDLALLGRRHTVGVRVRKLYTQHTGGGSLSFH